MNPFKLLWSFFAMIGDAVEALASWFHLGREYSDIQTKKILADLVEDDNGKYDKNTKLINQFKKKKE